MKNTDFKTNPRTNFIALTCFIFFVFSFITPLFVELKTEINWFYPITFGILTIGFYFSPEKVLNSFDNFIDRKSKEL